MSAPREHIVIQPTGSNVDFVERRRDVSGVWFQQNAAWIATLLPAAIAAACGGSNLTMSTWRKFPLRDPADFTIPSNEGAFLIRVYCPIGGSFDATLWTCLSYYDARRQPVISSERFHITGKGLQRILTELAGRSRRNRQAAHLGPQASRGKLGALGLEGARHRARLH